MSVTERIEECLKDKTLSSQYCFYKYKKMFEAEQFGQAMMADKCLNEVYRLDRGKVADKEIVRRAQGCHQKLRLDFMRGFGGWISSVQEGLRKQEPKAAV